jgi:hypothetical protein
VHFCVSGEFRGFTLICEENNLGGILIWVFLGICSGSHVDPLRRGGTYVTLLCVWGNFRSIGLGFVGS